MSVLVRTPKSVFSLVSCHMYILLDAKYSWGFLLHQFILFEASEVGHFCLKCYFGLIKSHAPCVTTLTGCCFTLLYRHALHPHHYIPNTLPICTAHPTANFNWLPATAYCHVISSYNVPSYYS